MTPPHDRDPHSLAHATLHRGRDRGPALEALLTLLDGQVRRVGLDGVLGDLNREGRDATNRVDGLAPVAHAFTWDDQDRATGRWWPQGITTSADAVPEGVGVDQPVVITSAYAKPVRGVAKGARVSVWDVSDLGRPRYRHVLLVDVDTDRDGQVTVRPLAVHAGGLLWLGPYLHVAATGRGFWTFRLDDLLQVDGPRDRDVIGLSPDGLAAFGYRYVLPARFGHVSRTAEGGEPLRFSFLSRSHGDEAPALLAGEYGRGAMSTRLWRYALDPETHLVASPDGGPAQPLPFPVTGVPQMQGAVQARGRTYATASRGRFRRGSLWVERDGALREHAFATPPGPEDITYWPERDQLWSLTEYPHSRVVFALDRRRFGD